METVYDFGAKRIYEPVLSPLTHSLRDYFGLKVTNTFYEYTLQLSYLFKQLDCVVLRISTYISDSLIICPRSWFTLFFNNFAPYFYPFPCTVRLFLLSKNKLQNSKTPLRFPL